MQAGALRHLFTLLEPSETGGDAQVTYTSRGSVWGSLVAGGGSETGLTAEAGYTIRLRYRADLAVTTRWELALGTRRFGITSIVDPDGRGQEWLVQATERVN